MKVITIGRSSKNDVVINDPLVGRNHCQIIQYDDNNFSIIDLNSTNGTFVNGRKIIGEVSLKSADIVRIGNTTLPWKTYFPNYMFSAIDEDDNYTPPKNHNQPQPRPLIEVPSNINVNQNIRQENINANVAKRGDDFKVPFFSNMGHVVGNTMGCISSIAIVIVILFIIGLIIKSCS